MIYYYICALALLAVALIAFSVGYRRGIRAKKIVIESLNFRQAMKWWAYHELLRHHDDIRQIRGDLKKLSDVEMPVGTDYSVWVDIEGRPKVR